MACRPIGYIWDFTATSAFLMLGL